MRCWHIAGHPPYLIQSAAWIQEGGGGVTRLQFVNRSGRAPDADGSSLGRAVIDACHFYPIKDQIPSEYLHIQKLFAWNHRFARPVPLHLEKKGGGGLNKLCLLFV